MLDKLIYIVRRKKKVRKCIAGVARVSGVNYSKYRVGMFNRVFRQYALTLVPR